MWAAARRRGARGHRRASRRGRARVDGGRRVQPVLLDRPDRRATARPLAPMLMWQDQRGTDHCFEIMARDEDAFMTFVERHGIPPIGGGLSLGHILYLQHDRPDVHARTAAYVEAMDYVTARLTGRITATPAQHVHVPAAATTARSAPTAYDDELVKLAGVDATRLPPLVADRRRDRAAAARRRARARPARDRRPCTRARTTPPPSRSRPARSRRAAPGISIGTTSVLVDEVDDFRVDLDHQIFSMPGPYPDRYVVCAENGLGGKVLEHVLRNVVYAADELGDHRADDPFAALDRTLARDRRRARAA